MWQDVFLVDGGGCVFQRCGTRGGPDDGSMGAYVAVRLGMYDVMPIGY